MLPLLLRRLLLLASGSTGCAPRAGQYKAHGREWLCVLLDRGETVSARAKDDGWDDPGGREGRVPFPRKMAWMMAWAY